MSNDQPLITSAFGFIPQSSGEKATNCYNVFTMLHRSEFYGCQDGIASHPPKLLKFRDSPCTRQSPRGKNSSPASSTSRTRECASNSRTAQISQRHSLRVGRRCCALRSCGDLRPVPKSPPASVGTAVERCLDIFSPCLQRGGG